MTRSVTFREPPIIHRTPRVHSWNDLLKEKPKLFVFMHIIPGEKYRLRFLPGVSIVDGKACFDEDKMPFKQKRIHYGPPGKTGTRAIECQGEGCKLCAENKVALSPPQNHAFSRFLIPVIDREVETFYEEPSVKIIVASKSMYEGFKRFLGHGLPLQVATPKPVLKPEAPPRFLWGYLLCFLMLFVVLSFTLQAIGQNYFLLGGALNALWITILFFFLGKPKEQEQEEPVPDVLPITSVFSPTQGVDLFVTRENFHEPTHSRSPFETSYCFSYTGNVGTPIFDDPDLQQKVPANIVEAFERAEQFLKREVE